MPSVVRVHAALICAQVSFGGGAIVGKFGTHGTNPILFALIREGIAGPLLCILAAARGNQMSSGHGVEATGRLPRPHDLVRFFFAGAAVFGNQLFFTLGLKLSSAIAGAAWQPSQPIFTTCFAIFLGYEEWSAHKGLGIIIATSGAIFMVLWNAEAGSAASFWGQPCFCLNCLSTACYFIASKDLLKRFNPVTVTGYSYMVAAVLMLGVFLLANAIPSWLDFVCSDIRPAVQRTCVEDAWRVPMSMVWCLAYWIVFSSIISYLCMTWANQHAKASVVSAYAVLQPCTAALISAMLRFSQGHAWADAYGFEPLGTQDLGMIGIVVGLLVLFQDPGGSMQKKESVESEIESEEMVGLVDDVGPSVLRSPALSAATVGKSAAEVFGRRGSIPS